MTANLQPANGTSQPPARDYEDKKQLAARDYEDKKQLAARLGVSVRTIDNLLTRGLPHIKLTRKLTRFPRAGVDEWLAERQVRRV